MERSDYVDLERLLPKDTRQDNRLEWVHKEGSTFLAPISQRETKITGIRRWDQAFRIYATFYCGANPKRAKEIWQYVDVIHTAAASYSWENVYNYDVTFRHLMEFNPARSWAVTYGHMWNISLRDPLTKNGYTSRNNSNHSGFSSANSFQANTSALNRNNSNNYGKGQSYKEQAAGDQANEQRNRYCWSFNKGEPCKFANRCRFIERCSYCDAAGHPVINCRKLKAKQAKIGGNKRGSTPPNAAHTSTNSSGSASAPSHQSA